LDGGVRCLMAFPALVKCAQCGKLLALACLPITGGHETRDRKWYLCQRCTEAPREEIRAKLEDERREIASMGCRGGLSSPKDDQDPGWDNAIRRLES